MNRLRRIFLAPSAAFLAAFFVFPFGLILIYSLRMRGVYGGVSSEWTAENFVRLADGLYAGVFLRTVAVSAAATAIALVLAFPLALFISRAGRRKNLLLQLVVLPFWTSFLVRTYAWMFLLRDTGLINATLQWTGLIREPLPLLYNTGAVLLGLVYAHLPFAVLPLYANLERLDRSLLEASADLGGRPSDTLRHVILPLCKPGMRAAALLVFVPCFGSFLTPDLLGGGKSVLIGNVIQNQFTTARDWPFGAALSLCVMGVVLALLRAFVRTDPEGGL